MISSELCLGGGDNKLIKPGEKCKQELWERTRKLLRKKVTSKIFDSSPVFFLVAFISISWEELRTVWELLYSIFYHFTKTTPKMEENGKIKYKFKRFFRPPENIHIFFSASCGEKLFISIVKNLNLLFTTSLRCFHTLILRYFLVYAQISNEKCFWLYDFCPQKNATLYETKWWLTQELQKFILIRQHFCDTMSLENLKKEQKHFSLP